ncbi:MAG TPA: DUF1049 domain-containing protein [Anaeromyxobacter sp.]
MLILAIVAAIAVGFLFGWVAHVFIEPSLESRMRDAAEAIRTRVRELTH